MRVGSLLRSPSYVRFFSAASSVLMVAAAVLLKGPWRNVLLFAGSPWFSRFPSLGFCCLVRTALGGLNHKFSSHQAVTAACETQVEYPSANVAPVSTSRQ